MNAFHSLLNLVEFDAFDVREDAFDFMLTRELTRIVRVLYQRLTRGFDLRQPL